MKILLMPCALVFSLTFASCDGQASTGENIAVRDVPPAVVTALSNKYPGASEISWEREYDGLDTIYEASFRYEGKKMDAEFDRTGALAERD